MTLSNAEKVITSVAGAVMAGMMIGSAYFGSRAGQDQRFDNVEDKVLMIEATYPDKESMVDVIKESIANHTAIPHPSSAPKQMLMDAKDDITELKIDLDKAAERQEEMRDDQVKQGNNLIEIKASVKNIENLLNQ